MTATVAAGHMPLREHAREARRRSTRAAVALLVGVIVGYLLSDAILAVLRAPIEQLAASRDASLNFDSVTGAFDLRLTIAAYAGVVLSSPIWMLELLGFLAPGLTRRERRLTFGFLGAAIPLFVAGCATGLYTFPHMVELLAAFASEQDSTILQASYYVKFVLSFVAAMGLAYVLPVFLVVLNAAGVLSARAIAHGWRAAVVTIVVFSAMVTPSADVASMVFVAVPMMTLYLAAVLVSFLRERLVARRSARNAKE